MLIHRPYISYLWMKHILFIDPHCISNPQFSRRLLMTMTLSETSSQDQLNIFKGATYQLSPLIIILSSLIISHNTVIFLDYYKNRRKLVPCLFMGIALSDILNAQGQLIVSVISILVFNGVVSEGVLYRSLYYYMATGLPGYSCSRLFNSALSLTLTVHLADPFRQLNTPRLKVIVLVLAAILTLLHVSDMVLFCVADFRYHIQEVSTKPFVSLILGFCNPGLITSAIIYCAPPDEIPEKSRCYGHQSRNSEDAIIGSFFTINFILPPLLILICMIVQVVYLKRSISEDISPLTSASRHASVTIVMVSLLFFVCHITFLTGCIIWAFVIGFTNQDPDKIPSPIHTGNVIGVTEFLLPLVFAALYPVILIARKPELRHRYYNCYRRVRSCFGRENRAELQN